MIDPRATWVSIERSNVLPKFEITQIAFNDPEESGGDANIYVSVTDEQGSPIDGLKVWLDTGVPDDRSFQFTVNGACNFPQTGDSNFNPNRGETGPYMVYVLGASDRAKGLGLPLKQHVRYSIRFKKKVVVTTPPGSPTDYRLLGKALRAAAEVLDPPSSLLERFFGKR